MKNLATLSSIFIFVFSSLTGELCSQPIRGNDCPIGWMFPEHVERSFLYPEYSFDEYFQLGWQRKVPVRISKDEASFDCYLSGRCERITTTLWSAALRIPRPSFDCCLSGRCERKTTTLWSASHGCTFAWHFRCGPIDGENAPHSPFTSVVCLWCQRPMSQISRVFWD